MRLLSACDEGRKGDCGFLKTHCETSLNEKGYLFLLRGADLIASTVRESERSSSRLCYRLTAAACCRGSR